MPLASSKFGFTLTYLCPNISQVTSSRVGNLLVLDNQNGTILGPKHKVSLKSLSKLCNSCTALLTSDMGTYVPLHSPLLQRVRSASRRVLCAMVLEAFRRQNDKSAAAMGCRLLGLMNSEKSILWGRKSLGPVVSQIVASTMNQGFNQGRIFIPNAFASSLQFLFG
jgi:hypothetical protein